MAMKARRFSDVRSPSPPRVRIRDHEHLQRRHEILERHPRHISSSSLIPVESERSRRILGGEHGRVSVEKRECDRHLDGDIDQQFRKLSQFGEALSRGESTSMKFQWRHLLAEPIKSNVNMNTTVKPCGDYGVGRSRMSIEKDHQGSFSYLAQHGMLLEKPISMENARAINFSSYPSDLDRGKCSVHVDGNFSSPLANVSMSIGRDEDLRFLDNHLHSEKLSAREIYKEEEKPLFYSRDESQYVIPSSQSQTFAMVSSSIPKNDLPETYKDVRTFPKRGFSGNCGMCSIPIGHDDYGKKQLYKSVLDSELQLNDATNYWKVELSRSEGQTKNYVYPEVKPSERSRMPCGYFENIGNVREDYGDRDLERTSRVDPIVDRTAVTKSSDREHPRQNRPWDQRHSFEECLMPSYPDATGISHARMQDADVLFSRRTQLEFGKKTYHNEMEIYHDHESLHLGEDYDFRRDAGPWLYEEGLDGLPTSECEHNLYGINDQPQEGLTKEELCLQDSSGKMRKKKRVKDKKLSNHRLISNLSSNWKSFQKINALIDENEQRSAGHMNRLFSSKMLGFSHSRNKHTQRAFDATVKHRDQSSSHNLSVSMQRHVSRSLKLVSRDIKKRLKPAPQNVHIPHPFVRKYKPHKFLEKRIGGVSRSFHVGESSSEERKASSAKTEPPEGSEDFKQLVQNTFLKFVRQLNENPTEQRRHLEGGKAGSLKCSICGSNSEDFVDTQSLAMHASISTLAGFRAQHLGFLKALCALMGWDSAVHPNHSWVCQVLPEAEALALKEDLVIWPPAVIVHNSSIQNNDPAQRLIVTIEVLKTILGDMGFGGRNPKVFRGKPANQSILVVTFSGTLSGLQEAERLHKFYAKNKHGRTEFRQINSNISNSSTEETQGASANKVNNVLYGYLGIAGDLCKLDFETKKRCVVRSKKEIQAIADAH